MDINIIQSALQSLKEERAHIEKYLQNAAAKKKELDKDLNAIFIEDYCLKIFDSLSYIWVSCNLMKNNTDKK